MQIQTSVPYILYLKSTKKALPFENKVFIKLTFNYIFYIPISKLLHMIDNLQFIPVSPAFLVEYPVPFYTFILLPVHKCPHFKINALDIFAL